MWGFQIGSQKSLRLYYFLKKSQLNQTYFRLKVRNKGLYLEAPCNCGRTQYGVGATGRTHWLGRLPGGEGDYTPFSPKLGKERSNNPNSISCLYYGKIVTIIMYESNTYLFISGE